MNQSFNLSARGLAFLLSISIIFYYQCSTEDISTLDFFTIKTLAPSEVLFGEAIFNGKIDNIGSKEGLSLGFIWARDRTVLERIIEKQSFNEVDNDIFIIENPLENNGDFAKKVIGLPVNQNTLYYVAFGKQTSSNIENPRIVISDDIQTLQFGFNLSIPEHKIDNNTVILTGEIIGLSNESGRAETFENHGFIIAKSPSELVALEDSPILDCTNPFVYCLGNGVGDIEYNFIDTINNLEFNTDYYVKAFLKGTNKDLVFSDAPEQISVKDGWVKSEKVLPSLSKIWGGFSLNTSATGLVGFGCRERDDCIGNFIYTKLLQFSQNAEQLAIEEIQLEPKEDLKQDGFFRHEAVAFTLNGYVYYGLGKVNTTNNFPTLYKDFWVINLADMTYKPLEVEFPGVKRYGAHVFIIDGTAYIGGGLGRNNSGNQYLNDFYKFIPSLENPFTGSWEVVSNSKIILNNLEVPNGRYSGISFSLDGKGYLGLGRTTNGFVLNDFWEFNPLEGEKGEWNYVATMPDAGRFGAVAVKIGAEVFFGTGYNNQEDLNDWWGIQKLGVGIEISKKQPLPLSESRLHSTAITLDEKGYLIGGRNIFGDKIFNNIYEYIPEKNNR